MDSHGSSFATPIIALVLAIASVIGVWLVLSYWIGCSGLDVVCWGSEPEGADETRSAVVRNIGFAVLGITGVVLGVWRTMISHMEALALRESADAAHKQLGISTRQMEVAVRQSELATQAVESANQTQYAAKAIERERVINRASQQLASSHLETRLAGISALRELFTDDHEAYIQVQSALGLFIRESSEAYIDEGKDTPCPDDVFEALSSISLLRNGGSVSGVEDASNWRPNLAGAWLMELKSQTRPLNFAGAELAGSNFVRSNLRRVNFSQADLTECDFTEARIHRGNMKSAAAPHCQFVGASLLGSDVSDSNLRNTNFAASELGGARFCEADLSDANFEGAVLEHDYYGTALFNGAILKGSKFSHSAKQLLEQQDTNLDEVVFVE